MDLLDFIFPKYCVNCKDFGDFLCSDCFSRLSFDTQSLCLICGKPTSNNLTHKLCKEKYSIDGIFIGITNNYIARKLVNKYENNPNLYSLSRFLGELLYESIIQHEEFNKIILKNSIVVPIPISGKNIRKKGYNPADLLAKELSRKLNIEKINILEYKNSFGFKEKPSDFRDTNILLVDLGINVKSLSEACRLLKEAGAANVFGILLTNKQ